MRSLSFSLGLVVFLALSNLTYGQFNSKEYLLSLSDLVNKKILSDPYSNPLQKLYYVHLLPPDYLWKDLATMISLRTETEYEKPRSFVDDFNTIVEKIRWSDTEPVKASFNTPVREFTTFPLNNTLKKAPDAYMPPVAITEKEAPKESNPAEKKKTASLNKPINTTSTTNEVSVETVMESESLVPENLDGIISDDFIEYGSIGFYSNAAVIHPSYKAEMASLAAHMKEDPTLELIIHGHCNGTSERAIIMPGILTRFFEIDMYHEQKTTSAKELSEMRAEYAKRYLVAQGVVPERIQTIGEGGEMMIYPSDSDQSRYNDRIELELIRPGVD